MNAPTVRKNDIGETIVTLPLEGTEDDGSPRQVVVTLPPGRELDTLAVFEILETLTRVASRTGIA